jgi:hypothetical protein
MTVGRLLAEASSQELSDWQAYLRVDARLRDEHRRRATEDVQIMGSE